MIQFYDYSKNFDYTFNYGCIRHIEETLKIETCCDDFPNCLQKIIYFFNN